jgi:hypothetical protein
VPDTQNITVNKYVPFTGTVNLPVLESNALPSLNIVIGKTIKLPVEPAVKWELRRALNATIGTLDLSEKRTFLYKLKIEFGPDLL